MRLIYDEMVYNTSRFASDIYSFLGHQMPKQTKAFLNKNTQNKVIVKRDKASGNRTATRKEYTDYAVSWKYIFYC